MLSGADEEEFAAAPDSESESQEEGEAGGMLLGNVVADRHGFQEPQAPPAMLHNAQGGLVKPPTFVFAGKGRQALDGRPLLLFDINGVLMQHRWNGTSHQHDLRPGVHHLLRLLPRFRLGVYSSATRPTISKALSKLHHNLANFVEQRRRGAAEAAAAARQATQPALPGGKKKRRAALAAAAAGGACEGVDGDGFPLSLPHIMFEVVMARDHCQAASPEAIEARGGRPWDTVKPLGRYFADLAGVLLVDDSAHKADEGEGSNMLVMPCWHGAGHPLGRADAVLPLLVDLLLERSAAGAAGDLRRLSAGISAALADAAARQLEAAHATSELSAEEAAAAASVLQAAVAGAATVAAAAAALEAEKAADAAEEPQGRSPQRQQGMKRAREEGGAAAPRVEAATEAAAAADPEQPRLTKKQRRAEKERREAAKAAAARDVLLAAAAAVGSGGGGGNLQGATLAQVNSYLNTTWPRLSLLLFKRTAKAGLAAACDAGLLQPLGGRAGKAGERYALTAAGDAAAACEQYMAQLDAYCSQLPDHDALLARLEARSKAQAPAREAAAAGAPAADAAPTAAGEDAGLEAGFFWEKPSASADHPTPAPSGEEPAAAAAGAAVPPPPPPGAAAADLPALQRAVLLHAVGKTQLLQGLSLDQAAEWAEAALQQADPELPLHDATADGGDGAAAPQRARLQRQLRTHLQRAMEACQKAMLGTVSRLGKGGPNSRVVFEPALGAEHPPPAQVQAALQLLAGVLGGGAAQAAVAAATPEALAAAGGDAGAAAAAAAPEAAAVPMLLDVFEDRAPPSAPPSAAGEAAAGSAPAGVGEEASAEAARKLQELNDAAAALKAQLAEVRRQARREGLTGRQLSQRVLAAKVAALTGRSDAELAGLSAKALKKHARSAAKEKRGAAASERSAAAAALLDSLFPAAAGGDDAGWAAACAALSEEERELLQSQGIDLEAYRKQVAVTGALAGPAASLGDWLCAGGERDEGEEGGSAGEVDGLPEGEAASVEVVAAEARGGHYLRSCDVSAAAAAGAGAEQPAWFWEQQQQQQQQQAQDAVQGAGAPVAAEQPPQKPPLEPQQAWAPTGQEGAMWQQQQYWAALQRQQEEVLWRQQAEAVRGAGPLSPLHHEVAALALRATPTPLEVASVQSAVLAVQETAASLWPSSRVALFGSQATGLALPGSDLDIVVLGVGPTLANAATGFTPVQRKQLAELLEDLLDALLQRRLLAGRAQIIEARVPIIKCRLAFGDGLAADISLGAENGAKAVDFVRRQVLAVPPLRPLCLVIKAFLRERCAHEVFTGGLSSYSVFNMIMAHLQLEGYQPVLAAPQPQEPAAQRGPPSRRPRPPPPADLHETLGFLHQLAAGALPTLSQAAEAEQQRAAQGQGQGKARRGQGQGKAPPADLGTLLWGFFDRFGNRFSYAKQAVSMRMGGVCLKLRQWNNVRRPWALAVEDPQEMGKDIGGGSTAIREIKESFAQAAETLAEVCEDLDANDAAAAAMAPTPDVGGAAQPPQQRPGQGPLLGGVLDVEAAVGRGPEAVKARAAMEATAAAKSQATLHERIRAGVAVGRGFGGFASAKRATRAARKVERLQRAAEAGGAQPAVRCHGGAGEARQQQPSPGGRKPGSKRGRAVEAAWGNKRGQYRDGSDDDGMASLRKQKKGKAKKKRASAAKGAAKGAAAKGASSSKGAASAKKQKRKGKAQGEGSGAAKRARKN